jgi:hypothetical protein
MHSELTKQLEKQFANKVAKEIDLDALAKKLAPTVEKELKKAIIDGIKSSNIEEWFYEAMGKNFFKALESSMVRAISKLK